jgi:hypothetical protein
VDPVDCSEREGAEVTKEFFALSDYGQGALWAIVAAESTGQTRKCFR